MARNPGNAETPYSKQSSHSMALRRMNEHTMGCSISKGQQSPTAFTCHLML
jgi:hypothetical protein